MNQSSQQPSDPVTQRPSDPAYYVEDCWISSPASTFNLCIDTSRLTLDLANVRGIINSKAGKAAASPKFLDTLNLSQSGGADYTQPLALLYLKFYMITPLNVKRIKPYAMFAMLSAIGS